MKKDNTVKINMDITYLFSFDDDEFDSLSDALDFCRDELEGYFDAIGVHHAQVKGSLYVKEKNKESEQIS